MKSPLDILPGEAGKLVREKEQPSWSSPMLATPADDVFSDDSWIFERKLDGERCLGFVSDGDVHLMLRNRKRLNDTYPEIEDALSGAVWDRDLIVDGEIVAFAKGLTSFSRLQGRMQVHSRSETRERARNIPVFYYLFDILFLDGAEVSRVPLRHRKSLLKRCMSFGGSVRFTLHHNSEGERFYREACRKGWEGLIAKKAEGRYVHRPSRNWLKFKCVHQQELVIAGYSEPGNARRRLGAILVGYYRGKDLVYAGKVGTGFNDKTLEDLAGRFRTLERKTSPFAEREPEEKGVHWVSPSLVAEIGFTGWTEGGKLRHPRYLGLRRDKDPAEVVRERPED